MYKRLNAIVATKTTWIFATIGTSGKNTNLREKKPDTEDKLNPIGGMCFSDLLNGMMVLWQFIIVLKTDETAGFKCSHHKEEVGKVADMSWFNILQFCTYKNTS